jgi:hypothetical protein
LIFDRLDKLERELEENKEFLNALASNVARDQGLTEMKFLSND